MFTRADRLLVEEDRIKLPNHIISFYWDDFTPHLEAYSPEEGELTEIELSSTDMIISDSRRCVGRLNEDGYHPCPNNSIVRSFSQCPSCASSWIPIQECIFEPRCSGDKCDCDFCRRRHVVYAAFTGDVVKIGMTSESRLRKRGIEQGADAIAPLVDCENRMEAREAEKWISRELGLRQSIDSRAFAKWLTTPPSRTQIERIHSDLVERMRRWRKDVRSEIEILDGYPIKELPNHPPKLVRIAGFHSGDTICVKGKYLVYKDRTSESPLMLEVADLPSRFIGRVSRK